MPAAVHASSCPVQVTTPPRMTLARHINGIRHNAGTALQQGDLDAARAALRSIGNVEHAVFQRYTRGALSSQNLLRLAGRLEEVRATLATFHWQGDGIVARNEALASLVTELRGVHSGHNADERHWSDRLLSADVQALPRAWTTSSEAGSTTASTSGQSPPGAGALAERSDDSACLPRRASDAGSMTNYFSLSTSSSDASTLTSDSELEPVSVRSATGSYPPLCSSIPPPANANDSGTARHGTPLPRMPDHVHTEPLPRVWFSRNILEKLAHWLRRALGREPSGGLRGDRRVYLGSNALPAVTAVNARRQALFQEFWAGHYDKAALAVAVQVSAENEQLAHGRMVEPADSHRLQRDMLVRQRRQPPHTASVERLQVLDALIAALGGNTQTRQQLADAYWAGVYPDYARLRGALIEQASRERPDLDPSATPSHAHVFATTALDALAFVKESAPVQQLNGEAVTRLHSVRDQLEQEIAASLVYGTRFSVDTDPRPPLPGAALTLFELPDGRRIPV